MKKNILLLLLIGYSLPQYAHIADEYTLSRIAYPQGLSNSAVISLYQDNQGFMWFGTYDGLNNFDGKNMQVYRTDSDLGQHLLNNVIYDVNAADNDCLWISTNSGINRFCIKEQQVTGTFEQFDNDFLLRSNRKGNTWIVNKDKVYYYNTFLKDFIQIKEKKLPYQPELSFVDENGNLWLFSSADNTVYKYRIDDFDSGNAVSSAIRANIHQKRITYTFYQEGILSFIDEESNLFIFDVGRNTKIYIRNVAELTQKFGAISGIVSFYDDILIAFVQNGLVKLEAASQYKETVIDRSIRIFSVYNDPAQEIIWLGTDGQGALAYTREHALANNIMFHDLQSKFTRQVRSVYTDKQGDLWFGTKGDGLARIKDYANLQQDIDPEAVSIYFPGTRQNMQNYTRALNEFQVFGLIPSQYMNGFWIGAADSPGLLYYNYETDKVTPVTGDNGILQRVHQVYEQNDTTLWITTAGWGLCKATLDKRKKDVEISHIQQFTFKENDKEINDFFPMVCQDDSILWLGSRGMGLVRFNLHTKQYNVYEPGDKNNMALNDILCIYPKEDVLYLGTVSGLVKFELDTAGKPKVTCIDREKGFLNDMIHGILEDENGYLWLSTNKGLIKYKTENNAFHTYYYTNGVQIGEFSDDAFYKCPYTGNLFFGGIDGLLYLEQERMNEAEHYPEVRFRDLTVGVEKVNLHDYYNQEKNQLTLHGLKQTFSISYVAPDFTGGDNFEYSYCLEKNGKAEWSPFSTNNTVSFQSLPHGNYTLKVKYKKDVFDTEHKIYSLHIRIQPPWYLSNLACILYICLLAFIVRYLIKACKRYCNREKHIKELMKRESGNNSPGNLAAQLHDTSNSFAIIYRMCGQLRRYKNMPPEFYKMLDIIHETTLSFVFKTEAAWNEYFRMDIVFPSGLPAYGEINPARISDEIIRMLIHRGFNELSDKEIDIQDAKIQLSKSGLRYILYFIYAEALHPKTHFPLYLKGKTIDNRFVLELFVSPAICCKLTASLIGSTPPPSTENSLFDSALNLRLCRYAIEKMGATVQPGPSGITIGFPIQENQPGKTAHSKEHKTILLLEDKDEIAWLIRDILSDTYSITRVYNSQEAFSYLEKNSPDIFLADTLIYLEDEYKFIKHIQTHQNLLANTSFIPMITWKAKLLLETELHGLIDGFVVMPYNILFIREILDMAINRTSKKDKLILDLPAEVNARLVCKTHEQALFAREIMRIIDENLDNENLTTTFISGQMSISPRQYYRRFNEICNVSPGDFIKMYRLEKAAILLSETDWPVQRVITEVGIHSRSYFHKEFTARFGVTPGVYQREGCIETHQTVV